MPQLLDFKSYFDEALSRDLQFRFSLVYPDFDQAVFNDAVGGLTRYKMKERIMILSRAIRICLPGDVDEAIGLLRQAFGAFPDKGLLHISGFPVWVALQFVEDYGIDTFTASMAAMYELTQRFSAEFAIRPFIIKHPDATMALLNHWVRDTNPHIRRLASEGTRPKLPWASRLPQFIADPRPIFTLIEPLLADSSEYVRRSVANNLNDIAKDHPDAVVDFVAHQLRISPDSTSLKWIVRHGCRSLIKSGHPGALALQGYSPSVAVDILQFSVDTKEISLGESLNLILKLKSLSKVEQSLLIDFAITYQKKRGVSRRVMKWARRKVGANESIGLERHLAIVPVSVRRYYSGIHKIELLVNGVSRASTTFVLNVA